MRKSGEGGLCAWDWGFSLTFGMPLAQITLSVLWGAVRLIRISPFRWANQQCVRGYLDTISLAPHWLPPAASAPQVEFRLKGLTNHRRGRLSANCIGTPIDEPERRVYSRFPQLFSQTKRSIRRPKERAERKSSEGQDRKETDRMIDQTCSAAVLITIAIGCLFFSNSNLPPLPLTEIGEEGTWRTGEKVQT